MGPPGKKILTSLRGYSFGSLLLQTVQAVSVIGLFRPEGLDPFVCLGLFLRDQLLFGEFVVVINGRVIVMESLVLKPAFFFILDYAVM